MIHHAFNPMHNRVENLLEGGALFVVLITYAASVTVQWPTTTPDTNTTTTVLALVLKLGILAVNGVLCLIFLLFLCMQTMVFLGGHVQYMFHKMQRKYK